MAVASQLLPHFPVCSSGPERDPSHLDKFFRENKVRLYRFARSLVKNADQADDIVAEVFYNLSKTPTEYQVDDPRFPNYVLRIITNQFITYCRKKGRQSDCLKLDEMAHEVAGTNADPAQLLEQKELAERIHRLIQRLPKDRRDVFVLSEMEGLSSQEIADQLKISLPAVRTKLFRARDELYESFRFEFGSANLPLDRPRRSHQCH